MKKFISVILILSIFSLQILTPRPAIAWWWSEADPMNKDLSFSAVYPVSFWQSTTGQIVKYTGIATVVGVATYFTAGAGLTALIASLTEAATPSIWALIWSVITVDGGTILTWFSSYFAVQSIIGGSFAVLAGVTALCAVGDLAIAGAVHLALDYAVDQVPSGTHKDELDVIKPPIFYGLTSDVVKDDLKELKGALEEFSKKPEKSQAQHIVALLEGVNNKLSYEVSVKKDDDTTACNYLLIAIVRYNLEKFAGIQEALDKARKYSAVDKTSVIDYIEALLALQNGNENRGIQLLNHISAKEPKVAVPYIVLGQLYTKHQNYNEAFQALDRGIKNTKEEKCVMNWMAGNSLYNLGRYEEAISYYKTALWNMTINEYEAIYKLCIAKCYKKMGDLQNGIYWLNDAISEVKDNKEMVKELNKQYLED